MTSVKEEPPNPLFNMVCSGKYACTSFHLVKLELPINKMAFLGGVTIESAFLKALISLIKGCAKAEFEKRPNNTISVTIQ